jgi:hypothetical protein
MAKNERKTENIVREELRQCGFYDPTSDIQVDEQKSNIEAIKKALKNASKSGGSGGGAPEFIVSSPSSSDFLLIIECKADVKDHASPAILGLLQTGAIAETDVARAKRTQRFAVDGALHYARALARDFNVIALGVSGETKKGALVSAYLWPKGGDKPKELRAKDGAALKGFIPWSDYIEHATFDPAVKKLRFDELMSFAAELHEFMRDHAKLTESEKPLLVSGTLIGSVRISVCEADWMVAEA